MNYRLGSNLVLAAVLTLAAVACKDDAKHGNGSDGGTQGGMHGDEADAGPAAPVRMARKEDVAALFKPLVDAICANAFSCCNADELAFQYGPGITADNCSAKILDAADQRRYGVPLSAAPELEVINDLARLQYGFDLGRARIDAEAVKACAALIEKRACAKDQPTDHCVARPSDEMDATAQLAAACAADTLVVGLQKMGADCDPDATDCAEALFCRSTGSSRGVCIAKAAAGDACLSDFDCGELVCDYATAKCVEGAGAGQACAYFDSALPNEGSETTRCKQGLLCDTVAFVCSDPVCAGGTSCNDETQCPEGLRCVRYRCGERLAAGVNCYQDDDCKSGHCTYDPSAQQSLCTELAVNGAPCNSPGDCASHFCNYSGASPVCAAQLDPGAPCPLGSQQCKSNRCVYDGVIDLRDECIAAAAAGDACVSDGDCNPGADLYCSAMKCKKGPLAVGAACTSADACASKQCLGDKCVALGKQGAVCGKADAPPCDPAFYCAATGGKPGKCQARKSFGATCDSALECWGSCQPSNGANRCNGHAPGDVLCSGK